MAGLTSNRRNRRRSRCTRQSRVLEVSFDDGAQFRIPFELMRVYSPSAEVQGQGPGQEVLQTGKRRGRHRARSSRSATTPCSRASPTATTPASSPGTTSTTWAPSRTSCGGDTRSGCGGRRGPRRADAEADGCACGRAHDGRRSRRPRSVATCTPRCPDVRHGRQTHFRIPDRSTSAKRRARVRGVFDSVASRYDLMNDLMSLGLHRAWKAYTVAVADVQPGERVLDIAGGTGDLARAFASAWGQRPGGAHATSTRRCCAPAVTACSTRACVLPTAGLRRRAAAVPRPARFDIVSVAFGLRNMTHKEAALTEMSRVLRPGGRLLVLEFSKVAAPLLPSPTTGIRSS